jgi:hypothetical protein
MKADSRKPLAGFVRFQPQDVNSGVSVLKLTHLRPGQRKLYELIANKLTTGDSVTLNEAKAIWLSRVHSNKTKDGHPLRWDYYGNPHYDEAGNITGYHGELKRMTEQEITFNVLNWLTSTIGILVIRGYLKVIPMIEVAPQELYSEKGK